MDTKVTLPEAITQEIIPFIESLGYKSRGEFIQQAVEEKILRLKYRIFGERSNEIRTALEKKGFSEEDIIRDFERFRDENYNRS